MVLSKQVSYRYHEKRKSPINGLFTPFMELCLLFKLLGGEIYLAVSWYTFVCFILHIHLILHFCIPRLKFLQPNKILMAFTLNIPVSKSIPPSNHVFLRQEYSIYNRKTTIYYPIFFFNSVINSSIFLSISRIIR